MHAKSKKMLLTRSAAFAIAGWPMAIGSTARVDETTEVSRSDIQNRKVNVFLNAGVMGRFDLLGSNP